MTPFRHRFIVRQRIVLVGLMIILSWLHAGVSKAEMPGDVTLHWSGRVYEWRYNPANEPAWLMKGETLAMTQRAAKAWEACGIRLRYAGLSDKTPGTMDGENVIGWKDDGKSYSAWTSWRMRRSGEAIEADITLYSNIFAVYQSNGIDARLELYKSIVHELGHVLGLGLSKACS